MVRGEGCDVGLGLEQGTIQDNQISSSLKTSDPGKGRLNNPSSAWCFEWSKLDSSSQVSSLILQDIVNPLYFVWCLSSVSLQFHLQEIYWQVDLESPTLISGFKSQGPPSQLYNASYIRNDIILTLTFNNFPPTQLNRFKLSIHGKVQRDLRMFLLLVTSVSLWR